MHRSQEKVRMPEYRKDAWGWSMNASIAGKSADAGVSEGCMGMVNECIDRPSWPGGVARSAGVVGQEKVL